MSRRLTGGCVCGAVRFSLEDDFSHFFFCHCQQCRKMSGSSHASNLFTRTDNLVWEQGEDQTVRYDYPGRTFTRVFCRHCGSGLPYVSQSGKSLVVPAGCLEQEPSKMPDAQIFCAEQTQWFKAGMAARHFDGFPE